MKTGYSNAQKSSLHPPNRPNHVIPKPKFGEHSAAVYNDEIETWHFADVQAACNHAASAIARNLIHRSKRLYDGDGKNEAHPIELSVQRSSPDIAIVKYTQEYPATYYHRATLFQHKGRNVDITIKRYAP